MSDRNKLYKMLFVAMMAAIIFVSTALLSFPIYAPQKTMIKSANIFCLLSGMLFGGVYGGLSAGIGSALYDLTDPVFVSSAPLTLIRFFLMGLICGWISHRRGAKGSNFKLNLIGAISGAGFSFLFYVTENIIKRMVDNLEFWPAVVAIAPKIMASGINTVIAVVFSMIIVTPVRKAMTKANVLEKMS